MENKKNSLSLSAKSFIVSILIIIALMIFAYILTFIIPAGSYVRVENSAGNLVIFTDENNPYGIFNETTRDFPFWKFLLSPILVLGSSDSVTLIAILIFILIIGGVFACLFEQDLISYFIKKIVKKYYKNRYVLLFVLPLIFMLLSSFAGCFEEYIPLIPILVSLAISLGWNNMIGITFSLVAGGCGYTAGILNPFGTGISQRVAGISAFSGIWLRIVVFIILYLILVGFLFVVTKRYERNHPYTPNEELINFEVNKSYEKSIKFFLFALGIGISIIISSTVITALQDYTLIIFALCFFVGGTFCCLMSGMKLKQFLKSFLKGMIDICPTIIMILLASSIKYILTESNTIDPLIKILINFSSGFSPYFLIIFIYLIVLVMEFFIPSGSAKAFLLIPLLLPVSSIMNISTNLLVLAYIFGDGLANVFYPTNPGLLISLNLAKTNYLNYFKFIWKIAIILFIVTCGILCFGLAVNYQ